MTQASLRPGEVHLSARQRQVLAGLAAGATAREIAQVLGISPRTVRVHVDILKSKLGARRSREIVFRYRLLTGHDPMALLESLPMSPSSAAA